MFSTICTTTMSRPGRPLMPAVLAVLAALHTVPAPAQELPVEIELSALDGSNGFVLRGVEASNAGSDVAGLGDYNGDGIDDLLIGARGTDLFNGEAYVVFGRSDGFPAELALTDFRDSPDGITLFGDDSASLGEGVAAAGDRNGDGLADLVVAEPRRNRDDVFDAGAIWYAFGDVSPTDRVADSALQGNLLGVNRDTRLGWSVDVAGDIDGDGRDDLVIGTYGRDAYVLFEPTNGLTTDQFLGSNGFVVTQINSQRRRGTVSAAGDFNGDGIDDVVIAGETVFKEHDAYLIFGRFRRFEASLDVFDLDGFNGFRIADGTSSDSDVSVDGGGDVNGDGVDDVVIAIASEADDTGRLYVLYGRRGTFDADFALGDVDGSNGFVINGVAAGGRAGTSVSITGDINQDGIADLIIGAPAASPGGRQNAGQTYVVFGRRGGFGASFDLADIDGANGFVINGADAGDRVGTVVAGDVNADGVGDALIGVEIDGGSSAGAAYVVYGQRTVRAADLAVDISPDADPVEQGAPIEYTVSVTNDGPDVATMVTVNTALDACLAAPVTVGCLEDPLGVPGCSLPDVPAGGMASFTITVDTQSCPPGVLISTVDVLGAEDDPDAADNAASATTMLSRRNGDVNADGCIDRNDQAITVIAVRRGIDGMRFDIDGDGLVTFADVSFLAGLFDNPDGGACN